MTAALGKQKVPSQTAATTQNPDALLKLQTVSEVTGLSGASIYRRVRAKQFPEPVRRGTRCSRWVAGQVTAWLREQVAAS